MRADRAKKEAERGQLSAFGIACERNWIKPSSGADLEGRLQASRSAEGTLQDEFKQLQEEALPRAGPAGGRPGRDPQERETEALRQERDLLRQR